MKLFRLADLQDLELVCIRFPNRPGKSVEERKKGKFVAYFKGIKVRTESVLSDVFGVGISPERAMRELIKGIRGRTIVIDRNIVKNIPLDLNL